MKTLLSELLLSASVQMWNREPTLSTYTQETTEHELNLAFHFACELKHWFPWFDLDFDVSKSNNAGKRPDIILHRRGSDFNFLVIEIKRECNPTGTMDDLNKIRDAWLARLKYYYGASLVLDEIQRTAKLCVLSRRAPSIEEWTIIEDLDRLHNRPKFIRVRRKSLERIINSYAQYYGTTTTPFAQRNHESVRDVTLNQLERQIKRLFSDAE